jgi:ABC-type lipoprotein release transport system permease subunit
MFRRKMRTSLCVIGVVLATTFIVAAGATTMRYTAVIREISVLFNGQVMVVSNGTIVVQAIPIGGGVLPQDITEHKIQNITGVERTVPMLFLTPIGIGGAIQPVPVNFSIGIPVTSWSLIIGPTPLKGNTGHFPTNESSNEIVAGDSLADEHGWTIGTVILVNGCRLEIVGILDTKLALLARCVMMPLELAQKVYNYPESVNIITVKPSQGYSEKTLADMIKGNITYVNALTEDERNDIIQPVLSQMETWNLGLQAAIFLLSLILVMTVTTMSVSERRRDFATLDAIGAPLSYALKLVIVEASLIGVLSGALGLVSGSFGALILASLLTNIPLTQFFPSIFEIVPPLYMVEMFFAVIFVSCLAGVVPAINAARTRIAEIMRAEY